VTCDDVRSRLIDALVTRRAPDDPAMLSHIESCPACRAAQTDYVALWEKLGTQSTPAPSPDAAARFARRLATSGLAPRARAGRLVHAWWFGASVAAALVVGLAGYRTGTRHPADRSSTDVASAVNAAPTFLLLLHVDSTFRRGEPPVQQSVLAAEYAAWANDLSTGIFVDGERLDDNRLVWLGAPTAEATQSDHVDGFFLIHAKDLKAARVIAASCPHLRHGGRIELREIDQS
jgi:hypothetical protein